MENTKRVLEYKADPNKFDLQTHRWDNQGRLVSKNPYRTHIIEGTVYYERPVNSGNLWTEGNQPIGRMEYVFGENGKISKKTLKLGEAHKTYVAPLTGAEATHYELAQTKEKLEAAQAELAQIKAEAAKRQQPAQAAKKGEA